MKSSTSRWAIVTVLVFAFLLGACESQPFLKINYQLPSPSSALKGKTIVLNIVDMRTGSGFLTENARDSLNDFSGEFSLVVLNEDGSGNLVGAYNQVSLIREVFRQRLENAGIQVAAGADQELKIEVEELKLDYAAHKWTVNMNYRAGLWEDGSLVSREEVRAEAERLKMSGKKDAEKVLGEMISDAVNRLNLIHLFQQG